METEKENIKWKRYGILIQEPYNVVEKYTQWEYHEKDAQCFL